ncbi:MAG: hypothetical protein HOC74_38020 [Gemmatimonadetes bacterium]|nr:hypothetical protein [Gemmatimonadota bacterium]
MTKLRDVNTTDIAGAIRLGCRTMSSVFNADDDHIPFFGSQVWPEARLSWSAHHSESHIPGRHLNALLNAEDALGLTLDEEAVERHARAAFLSYSGPIALPLNREAPGGPLVNFCPHNVREGFHALYALVAYRNSERARELAERSIDAIFDLWDVEHGWDLERLQKMGLQYQPCQSFIHGLARTIGPLVKYFRTTGYGPALELALVLAEKALPAYPVDGSFDPEKMGTTHGHSITSVLSSLAQLAEVLPGRGLMERVGAFYDRGLWAVRDELGWSPESSIQEDTDHGEGNNTGDILETGLILAAGGESGRYQDVERILRGHLLPAQLCDISFIEESPNPEGIDGLRDVADRHRGSFGFPAPYGHKSTGAGRGRGISFNMDIVGGVIASLCEAWRAGVRKDERGVFVNLLFDRERDAVEVESPYTHEVLQVTAKREEALWVRLPEWVDRDRLEVEGYDGEVRFCEGYAFLARPTAGRPIRFAFPLVEQEIDLSHAARPIRTRLRGDAVAAMENFGADLTFFEPIG